MNRWGIPGWLEEKVRRRDVRCVYCRVVMVERRLATAARSRWATWEHIDNDGPCSELNIALCCGSCNASKGTKKLRTWFASEYCRSREINERTVLPVVRKWLRRRKAR